MPQRPGGSKVDQGVLRPRAVRIAVPVPRESRRPKVRLVVPLFSTFDQTKPEGAYFDEGEAERAVRFVERLRHFQGRWSGGRFFLLEWQRRIVRELFGWRRADGSRLIRRVYIEAPRKTGKTSFAAAVGLYAGFEDGEPGAQVVFAAVDRDQAGHAYEAAKHMVLSDGELAERTAIYNFRRHMLILDNPGAKIDVLSSEAMKQFGSNIHCAIIDEVAFHPDRRLYDALSTATGAREQPIIFAITTAGWNQNSVAFELREHTRHIFEGSVQDLAFLGVVFGAEMDADWTLEETWLQANPSLGETVSLDHYREQAATAQAIPAEQNRFRTLLLSQWVGQATRMIEMGAWDRCQDKPGDPGKRVAFGGLDLASTMDLTAFLVVAKADDGFYDVYPHFFCPEEGLRERSLKDRAPYDVWAREGFLTPTPGRITDYQYVRQAIKQASEGFDLRDVSYDPWNASQFVQQLSEEDGLTMVQVRQGFASLSAPTKELIRLIQEGKLRHGGHPVLRWCADNVAPDLDANLNIKPSKQRSGGRIDGISALILAIDGVTRRGSQVPRASVFDSQLCSCSRRQPVPHLRKPDCEALASIS